MADGLEAGNPPRSGRRSRSRDPHRERRDERRDERINIDARRRSRHAGRSGNRRTVVDGDGNDSEDCSSPNEKRPRRSQPGRGRAKSRPPPPWAGSEHPDDLQTHYKSLGDSAQTHLARTYVKKKQLRHLLGKILLRWFCSFILAVVMLAVFYAYEQIHILTKNQRRTFNLLKTGLYLTLGLNLAASLKSMAILVRWRLLSRKKHQLEEIDFLLGLQSLIKVFRFGVHSFSRQPWTTAACFGWIAINTVGRLSVALTGLTYSYDSANATAIAPGIVNITDWAKLAEAEPFLDERDIGDRWVLGAEHYAAHSYGLFSATLQEQNLTEAGASDINAPLHAPIEITDNGYRYYFREFGMPAEISYKSSRYVEVKAHCNQYPITKGQTGQSTEITYSNGTTDITLKLPGRFGPASTTWVNPRGDLPKNSIWSCGPRCSAVLALQFRDIDDETPGALYDCHVTVSAVQDATEMGHEIPDNVARIIAGGIGLEGYSNGPNDWEYSRYPPGSAWSNYRGGVDDDATTMARKAARFAVGAIAVKDIHAKKPMQVPGNAPWIGVLLKIKWHYLFAILGSILGVQLGMGVGAAFYANEVFCKDDSYLSTARLLRPVVERLGPSGCAITGKEIAHTLGVNMSYGVRIDETGERMHLDIGEDIEASTNFPEGWYDGDKWLERGKPTESSTDHARALVG